MKKNKFPLPHIVLEEKKEVWIRCTSAITAMGISTLVKQYYPGYTGRIASEEYFKEIGGQLKN